MDHEESGRVTDEKAPLKRSTALMPQWRGGVAIIATGLAAVLILAFTTDQFSGEALAGDTAGGAEPVTEVTPLVVAIYTAEEDTAWNDFVVTYKKKYASTAEAAAKRSNFHGRVAELDTRNALNGASVFGITATTDRDPGTSAFGRGRKNSGAAASHYGESPELVDLDAWRASVGDSKDWGSDGAVDWRSVAGAVTPVKNQGQCGSCWAFSATSQVESQFAIAERATVVLSAQQVTSCATPVTPGLDEGCCFGCAGGDTVVAYEYLMGAVGHAPAAFWPYTQALVPDEACSMSDCTAPCDKPLNQLEKDTMYIGPYAKLSGYAFATPPCTSDCSNQDLAALAATLDTMPVSVCVNAANWDDYVGGVLTAHSCGGEDYSDIDHCVQLVGYDARGDEPYWIVRNSWSTAWGELGYIRLAFDGNTCGVANEATVVKLDSAGIDSEL